MPRLSDSIERFIKAMIDDGESRVDLQRNELASYFSCAPSQINYVLATRFTLDKGYYIESRRGGGGYIRVVRLDADESDYLLHLITSRIGSAISENQTRQILDCLAEREIITSREKALIGAALSDKAIAVPIQIKDRIRANLFRNMLTAIVYSNEEGEK
ncbi:MAG: CtsR family transcriptional regulator [Clostridiales bacterium]|nr:CtsR family transcriptional regulator [Clostridiales bacterium]